MLTTTCLFILYLNLRIIHSEKPFQSCAKSAVQTRIPKLAILTPNLNQKILIYEQVVKV